MLPEAFRQRLRTQQYIIADELFSALEKPSEPAIRINREKWDLTPASSEQVSWSRDGYYLEKRPFFTLDPQFHAGCYYPQESSGMFLEQVLKQTFENPENIKVLDLCGAPGGKSTHLSSMIGNAGLLVANEVIRSRAMILAENLTKWGASNCIVTQSDPSAFRNLPGFFDLILVDAPCSGEGMFRDPVAVNEWSEENAALCSERQKRILMDVWPSLRKEGILIYSTCTFNPAENEGNIRWLAERKEAESVRLDISDYEGIKEIDYHGIYGYGFYPGKVRGEGLFISVLRKTVAPETGHSGRRFDKVPGIGKDERKTISGWSLFHEDNVARLGDFLIALPGNKSDFQQLAKMLKIIKPGTKIAELKKKSPLPDHELAMSVFFRKGSFPAIDLDEVQALAYLGRENFQLNNVPMGWINVCYKNVSLGFLNNIGTRFNNYYPVDWRIRMDPRNRILTYRIKWQ
jgi:16S rRNA C967 or C1407 C5-methylase (RsmB/RsmF family)/NOL1/NOP2/fmu family ribosome biogenesis protein